jgi:hypothetical protein
VAAGRTRRPVSDLTGRHRDGRACADPAGCALFLYLTDAVKHPVLAPYAWLAEHVLLPHLTVVGWGWGWPWSGLCIRADPGG